MLISNATLNALRVGLKNTWTDAYQAVSENELWYLKIAEETTSEDASEVYRIQDTLFRLREWLGARVVNNLIEKSMTVVNKEYELTFGLKVTDVEDDKFGNMQNGIKSMGRASRLWPNDLVAAAFTSALTTACYDGQFYFDTDHPCDDGTTQMNLYAGSALTAANYGTGRKNMAIRKGNDGKPLGLRCTHLVVPPSLEDTGKRILKATQAGYLLNSASTASDTNIYEGTAELIVIPELEALSATSWYLADLSKPIKPFIFQKRLAPEAPTILNRPTDQGVFDEGTIKVGTRARGAAAFSLWQLIQKHNA